MPDCAVCCEKLNISNRKKVNCPFCDFSSCRSCVQKFLLGISSDPHCMSCNKLWSRDVVDDSCTATFRNGELKKHRENLLLEREKCLMPATIPAVLKVKSIRNLTVLIEEAQSKVTQAQLLVMRLTRTQNILKNGGTLEEETEKRKFVRKCPSSECKGFLTTQWRCELCEKHICKFCNEHRENDEHVCDQNNVQTVELLNKDTKPCPSCGTMIFKISGCNQMWCPDCHTAFDWISLRIETGRVHNPHYYDFQRSLYNGAPPREPGDIPCGGLPHITEIIRTLHIPYRTIVTGNKLLVQSIHRLIQHVNAYEFRANDAADNEQLRVRYMMNEMHENIFKKILQRNEKFREKDRDVQQIFRMFSDVISEHLRQFVNKQLELDEMIGTFEQLRTYTNSAFSTVNKRYKLKTPFIDDQWSTHYY